MIVRIILLIFPFLKEIIITSGWYKTHITNPKSIGKFVLVTVITIFIWSTISDMLEHRSKESDRRFRELVNDYYELEQHSFALSRRYQALYREYHVLHNQVLSLESIVAFQYDQLVGRDDLTDALKEKKRSLKIFLDNIQHINQTTTQQLRTFDES